MSWVSGPNQGVATDIAFNAKGDIIVGTADNAGAALTAGAVNSYALQVDSTTSSGLIWSQPDYVKPQHGLLAYSFEPLMVSAQVQPAAATIHLCKIMIPTTITATNLVVNVSTAGNSYTNTQLGLYASDGTFLRATAVLASGGTNTVGTGGDKVVALSSSVAITGGPTVFVWGAVHMGTNSATAVKLSGITQSGVGGASGVGTGNFNLAASTMRAGTQVGHATNALATIGNLTPGSGSLNANSVLIGIT